jgi:hypothetical protein
MAKNKKGAVDSIALRIKGTEKQKEFSIDHALNVLRIPNSQWEIADKSYIFENNDIKRVPSQADNSAPKE